MQNKNNDLLLISKYRNQIMGFAAIWILLFHEWFILSNDKSTIFSKVAINFINFGYCGVDIFFFLSGMSLVYAIKKETVLKFYLNRFKRIILPFLLTAIIQMIDNNLTVLEMLKNLFGVNFILKDIYSFLWFGPAIMILYLLFPIYYKLFAKSKSKLAFTLIILEIWFIISVICSSGPREDIFGFTNRIPIFLIGIYLGYLGQNKEIKFSSTEWLLIITTFIIGLVLLFISNYHYYSSIIKQFNCLLPTLFTAIPLSFLIGKFLDLLASIDNIKTLNTLINKILLFFGSISLELYCIQERFGEYITNYLYTHFICSQLTVNIVLMISLSIIAYILMSIFKYFWKLVSSLFSRKENKQ